jgi:4-hydroxybenzoate polyprenyltransferase
MTMNNNASTLLLGLLMTAFFTMLWKLVNGVEDRLGTRINEVKTDLGTRIDKIDATLVVIQNDLREFNGGLRHVEGRVDEISKHI